MREPAELVEELERHAELPPGSGERFSGYGVMGLPFASGHVLGLRRFPASSIGPGYRSGEHRKLDDLRQGPVEIDWTGRRRLEVRAGDLEWATEWHSTPVTRLFNTVASALPGRAWRSPPVLTVMSRVAGVALRAGRVRLAGRAPNGQRFAANPLALWVAGASRATIGTRDLGEMGPAPRQAQLGDFALPQRGMFVVGRAVFIGS